jgi:hypothetical protein
MVKDNLLQALPSAAAATRCADEQTTGRAVSDRALVRCFCFEMSTRLLPLEEKISEYSSARCI